ncbi:MAG: alpha/beta fold hydrolase [Rhodobacteraceae bacterium]|nr:alpha/beta fold hydrolase [Paracoccaceae bacterium]
MRVILGVLVIEALVLLVLAFGLIASQRLGAQEMDGAGGLDFSGVLQGGIDMPKTQGVKMRDGYELQVRSFGNTGAPLVVLVHGSGWNGLQFNKLSASLKDDFAVLVPDLRGHGAAPGRRGDVDYIGQFEDDLADLITARVGPGQKVILLGHSSGGGLVVRFAGGAHGGLIDGAVLLAPFLKYNAPTTRKNSGGWAHPLTRRIIGLSMLNMVGIRGLNHLEIIQFNMPRAVLDGDLGHLATTSYSYRLNTSFAPRSNYLKDISALPPYLLMAGTLDEAFHGDRYKDVMSRASNKGRYQLVPDTGHLAIVDAPETATAIAAFIDAL